MGYAVTALNAMGDGNLVFFLPPSTTITLTQPLPSLTQNVTVTGTDVAVMGQSSGPAQLLFQKNFSLSNNLILETLTSTGDGYDASVTAASFLINPTASINMTAGDANNQSTSGGSNLTGYSGGTASVQAGTWNLNSISGAVINGGNGGAVSDVGGTGDQGGSGGDALISGNALTLTGTNFTLNGGLGGDGYDPSGSPTGGSGGTASVSFGSLTGLSNSNLTLNGGNGGYGPTGGTGGDVLGQMGTLSLTQCQFNFQGHDGRGGIHAGGTGGAASVSFGSLIENNQGTNQAYLRVTGGNGSIGDSGAGDGGTAMVQGTSAAVTGSQFLVTGGSGGSLNGTTPGTTSAQGGNGADASVSLSTITADTGSFISVSGGTGGNGGNQSVAGQGGNGGNAALSLGSLSMGTSVQFYIQGGSGGTGGNGTSGGDGGAGGSAGTTLTSLTMGAGSVFSLTAGSGGAAGTSGINGSNGNSLASIASLNGTGLVNVTGGNGGTLQLTNGLYSGNIMVGNLQLLSSGTLTLNGTSTLSAGASIAGNLTLGSSAGTGNILGPVTVFSGALLTGYGTVVGTVTNSGTITPLGTTRQATMTFSQFDPQSNGVLDLSLSPNSLNTTLSITTGAQLNGTLNATPQAGNYGFRDRYQILSGAPVTGTFSTVNVSVAGMGSTMVYGSNTVTLFLIKNHSPFASYALNSNETAVGSALDNSILTSSDSLAVKMGEINALSSGQAGVLNQMGGVVYTALPEALLNQTQFEDGLIFGHMDTGITSGPNLARLVTPNGSPLSPAAKQGGSASASGSNRQDPSTEGLWLETADNFGSSNATSQVSRFNISNYGVVGGYDWNLAYGTSMGILGGYLQSGIQPTDGSANAQITGTQFGLYGMSAFDNFDVAVMGAYVMNHFNVTRAVNIGTDANSLAGSYDGSQIQAALQMDMRLNDVGSTFRPFWGLLYAHLNENAFSETGSDSLALALPAQSYDSARAFAGLEETFKFSLGKDSTLSPRLHASVSQDLASLNPAFQTLLNGAPGNPFQITGLVPDATEFGVGGGLDLTLSPLFDIFTDFEGHFSSTGNLSTISGGMSLDI